MARANPQEILDTEPHIVERFYDENGREIGWIADNFVVKTQQEVDNILEELGKIWGESYDRKAREELMAKSY
ncbi:MAG: hypothetical protein ACI4KA_01700 [Oscillospiraceae bacterium]